MSNSIDVIGGTIEVKLSDVVIITSEMPAMELMSWLSPGVTLLLWALSSGCPNALAVFDDGI